MKAAGDNSCDSSAIPPPSCVPVLPPERIQAIFRAARSGSPTDFEAAAGRGWPQWAAGLVHPNSGRGLLGDACSFGNRECAALLAAKARGIRSQANDALLGALRDGDMSCLEVALVVGASSNAVAADGTPALHLAIKNLEAPFVVRLLQAGADPECRDLRGTSAMTVAEDFATQLVQKIVKGAIQSKLARASATLALPRPGSCSCLSDLPVHARSQRKPSIG